MVGRIWRGYTKPENADKYEALLKTEIFPEIAGKDIPGYRGTQLFREPAEGKSEVEFVTIMWFEPWEAVRRFAGEDYERAYVPPEGAGGTGEVRQAFALLRGQRTLRVLACGLLRCMVPPCPARPEFSNASGLLAAAPQRGESEAPVRVLVEHALGGQAPQHAA